jgi:hypothetical protein
LALLCVKLTIFRVLEIKDEENFEKWFLEYKAKSKTGRNKTKNSARNLDCPTKLKVRIKKGLKICALQG